MAINRIRADIDLDAILYNMESMHNKLKPGTMMAAVVKADGYGHGAEAVSEVLEPLPYLWGYAVATSNEAMHNCDYFCLLINCTCYFFPNCFH